jgi:signal recognition particle receptor subunit beta
LSLINTMEVLLTQWKPVHNLLRPFLSGLLQHLNDPAVTLGIAVALVVVLLIVLQLLVRPTSKNNLFLIVGPSNAGKTALFFRIWLDKAVNSVTSMKENDGTFVFPSEKGTSARPIRFIDVPGHLRARGVAKEYLPRAAGILFIIDAADFQVRQAAEALFFVLSNRLVRTRRIPILLVLNKVDAAAASQNPSDLSSSIQAQLEKELTVLRHTKKALPSDEAEDFNLGVFSDTVTFADLPTPISIAQASATRPNSLHEVQSFVRRLWRA